MVAIDTGSMWPKANLLGRKFFKENMLLSQILSNIYSCKHIDGPLPGFLKEPIQGRSFFNFTVNLHLLREVKW